ncbi:hypothetical protein J2S25_000024 [Mesobacillus stamsii]|uniref:Uncharacterized protein n=1 Tax=Mesobacillus stamsii TaxID=225347 RepID=A0ABU0FPL0_9BACI|nr:hypothetical protein [Mesobacillus stamsii]
MKLLLEAFKSGENAGIMHVSSIYIGKIYMDKL